MPAANRLVILDRDGVINQDSDEYVKSLEEWIPYPAAIEAIARLSRAGWTVAVATNQSGIARGHYGVEMLEAMHHRLHELVGEAGGEIAYIAHCPHGPEAGCKCRKPLPGLLEEIREALALKGLEGSWMVGDSLRDLQAGETLGCRPVLVRTGKGIRTEKKGEGLEGAMIFDDLAAFVDWLLAQEVIDQQDDSPGRR
ncbi:MAG: D-glycero-beta-D-manno-heptose 1,7-bisphosphate 7-phosphatase [Halomonas sp.]|uniref:D-glycero-beta-D-manno-heptose 1,7-bisphosphate 7-phosphatase n=1 Tax=Halomonas sp. TaxID=1486246 RepID=UPI00286FC284|nr:D-glycero-beta-D-manno-heptose 1,7-bisphosphate 7-phosphatase [Halomonas sp.]MDR9437917.1 D-glycero-beta-D-manno-heptose 1,7-bisphosphate 7-phosphatase [Halomonas sp.]